MNFTVSFSNPLARFMKVGEKPMSDVDKFPIIRDQKTDLMWDRREFDSMTMEQAIAHIAKLNKEKFGGYSDWRLPEHDELRTLIDLKKFNPATDKEAFPDVKNSWYRSATPDAEDPSDYAWVVYFDFGYSFRNHHDGYGFVRAVRGGQS